jgi:hypothetical protein
MIVRGLNGLDAVIRREVTVTYPRQANPLRGCIGSVDRKLRRLVFVEVHQQIASRLKQIDAVET